MKISVQSSPSPSLPGNYQWLNACENLHRVHPDSHKNRIKSDLVLSAGVQLGEFRSQIRLRRTCSIKAEWHSTYGRGVDAPLDLPASGVGLEAAYDGRYERAHPAYLAAHFLSSQFGQIEQIKEQLLHVPYSLLNPKDEEDMLKSYSLGANSYLQEPVSFDGFR